MRMAGSGWKGRILSPEQDSVRIPANSWKKGRSNPAPAVAGARQSLDRKALVRDIQGQLNRLGYPVGKPDNELREALKRAKEQLLRSARFFS